MLAAATLMALAFFGGTTDPRHGDRRFDGQAPERPVGLTQSISTSPLAFQARAEPGRLVSPRHARTSPLRPAVFSVVVAVNAGLAWRRFRNWTVPPPVPLRLLVNTPHRGPPLPLG